MDRIRSAFNSMMKSERYSRFTLHSGENGERHAEVNLSDDVTDDATDVEVHGSPSFRPAPIQRRRRTLICMILGVLLVFVFGYLVGYISHKKPRSKSSCEQQMKNQMNRTNETKASATAMPEPPPDVQLTWQEVTQLLSDKLTAQAFEKTLGDFDRPSRSAGSEEDIGLANRIHDAFKSLNMEPWTDRHYVQLQTPDSNLPNSIQFGSATFKPEGYLAYSAPGRVQGRLVYGNYGRQEDLELVQKSVELTGCVLLLRAGSISFAQQVDNAAKMGASAVLIYPDPQDYQMVATTELYGHVHLGSGDPYTPGFPSFNHTQFAQTKSSGLPKIPAQTITAGIATTLLQKIGGPNASNDFKGGIQSMTYKLGGVENVTVEVNNVLVSKELHNVFGVIKGFIDPDRYVVLGAHRDAWGQGYAKATVGTSVLVELAKALHDMVEKDGFRPRRSLVFASWSAGEYGSVGATEWLEGYMSSIDKSVISYISLDGVVMGRGSFIASASPLLTSLIESTMKEVKMPVGSDTIYKMMGENKWETKVLRPMSMDDPAYPFLAFSGIPSISFHFISENTESYAYYGTNLDNKDHLNYQTNQHTSEIAVKAAQFAGQMALRLVHDHLLNLDVNRYGSLLTKAVAKVYKHINQLSRSGNLKEVSPKWLNEARGSYQRAADTINNAIVNTDLTDREACRLLNDRIMRVEHSLLSPYVSPVETPFRHLLLGRGSHTLESIAKMTDAEQLRTQLALATWNLQGCANAMVENIWDIDDEI